jgi:hypothetical protein
MRNGTADLSAPIPQGVIMRAIRAFIFGAYITVWTVAMILGPLILLHGYRAWWLDTAYAVLACAAIGGNIRHYRTAQHNGHS